MYASDCCDLRYDARVNPRHLWSEYDSTRWYFDPEGWDSHEASCPECRTEL